MTGVKISEIFQAYEAYGVKKPAHSQRPESAEAKKDELTLSGQAKDYQTALKILADVPDVREGAVLAASGYKAAYVASSNDMAEKLIDKWAALE